MQGIIDNEPMGRYLNPYITAFMVALEGLFSGLLFTFIIINYIDTDEIIARTDPKNSGSVPLDTDGDYISNATDPDDDNDGVEDSLDDFP